MTETGLPRPAPEAATADPVGHPGDAPQGTGPDGDDGRTPPPSPAQVRAAKLNWANMVRSLAPLLVICLGLVGWASWRQIPDDPVREVDPSSSVRLTAERAGFDVLVPTGLEGYRPTSARTTAGGSAPGDPVVLEIGYLTPDEAFAGFVLTDDAGADALQRVLEGAEDDGSAEIGGRDWERLVTPRGETAYVLQDGDATAVVHGSASDAELTEVASSLAPYEG